MMLLQVIIVTYVQLQLNSANDLLGYSNET